MERGALVAGYEQLRAAAVAGAGGGHGLAVLVTRGMAGWIAAWRTLRPCPPPPTAAPAGAVPDDVVAVLASMAAACLAGG